MGSIFCGPDGVQEGTMGGESCTIGFGVVALDQSNFVRGLVRQIIPFMTGVVFDRKSRYEIFSRKSTDAEGAEAQEKSVPPTRSG